MNPIMSQFHSESTVAIDATLIRESFRASQVQGLQYKNPCNVCKCNAVAHRIRRGEIICEVHEISCSKELGIQMREWREERDREKRTAAQAAPA